MRLKEALEGALLCAVFVVDCTDLAEGSFQTSPAKCVSKGRESKTREARFLPGLVVRRAGGHSVRTAQCWVFLLPYVQSCRSYTIFQPCSQSWAFCSDIQHRGMWALHWHCFPSVWEEDSIIPSYLHGKWDVGSLVSKAPSGVGCPLLRTFFFRPFGIIFHFIMLKSKLLLTSAAVINAWGFCVSDPRPQLAM